MSCSINVRAYCGTSFSPSAARVEGKGHFSNQTRSSPSACVEDDKAPSPAVYCPSNLLYQPPHTPRQQLSHFSQHQKHWEGHESTGCWDPQVAMTVMQVQKPSSETHPPKVPPKPPGALSSHMTSEEFWSRAVPCFLICKM